MTHVVATLLSRPRGMPRRCATIRLRPLAPSWKPANPLWQGVGLGTAVRIWLPTVYGGSVQEGVVVAVVPPGGIVAIRVDNPRPPQGWRMVATHYVVQCRTARVLRRAAEMDVVCL